MEVKDYDLVIEGGGVKGIALAGAVVELERNGYRPKNVAGTSAGAIIAAMLAAGYTGEEIKTEIKNIEYRRFMGEDLIDKFGALGKGISLFHSYGIYNCNYIEELIGALLARKGKMVFGDLPKWTPNGQCCGCSRLYNLCVTATDLTTGRLLVLPDDLTEFGIDPAGFPISTAVKISISFPLFFEPFKLTDTEGRAHYLVDGGMLSNYPAFILDDGRTELSRPVIGVRFLDENCVSNNCPEKDSFIEYMKSMVATLTEFHDGVYVERTPGDTARTVFVSPAVNGKAMKTMNFNIKQTEADILFANGVAAAEKFLQTFTFCDWWGKYRTENKSN